MNLQPIIQSEVSKRKTNMESRKMVMMNVFSEQQWRHRHREQICQHSREGESGMS